MTRAEITKWHKDHPYESRTEEYVDSVLARVKQEWLARPQLRLGQLLVNLAGSTLFHVPDEEW